jgi:nitrogen regulatory protein P-II 1
VQLLIAVINHPEKLDEILSGFVELGITGATILNSEGMGHVLAQDVPIFAGITALAAYSRARNYTIFSVIREPEKVDRVINLLQEICGNLEDPATGIVFTLPATRVVGLAAELGAEHATDLDPQSGPGPSDDAR